MVHSVDDLKTLQSFRGHRFPNFEMRRLRPPWKGSSGTPTSRKSQSAPAKGPIGRPTSQWKTDCFYDLRRLSRTWTHEAVLDFSDLFRITLHGDDVQIFDTRWDEVLLPTSQVPSDDVLESLYKITWVWSTQNRSYKCMTLKLIKLAVKLSEVEDYGKDMYRSKD